MKKKKKRNELLERKKDREKKTIVIESSLSPNFPLILKTEFISYEKKIFFLGMPILKYNLTCE